MANKAKNLANLCIDVLYDHGKTITKQFSKNVRELTEERRVQLTLHNVLKVLKLWDFPNFIQQYENNQTIWNIRIQDISYPDFVTLTLPLESATELERFRAFLRHLISNWSRNIKVQKIDNGQLSFVVTHPALALLHIFPQGHTNLDEHFKFSTTKSSHVETVSKIISLMAKEFCLCILNKPEKLSGNIGEKRQNEETTTSQSSDKYPVFRGNDIFTPDFYYYHNIPSHVLLNQLNQAYISVSNVSQKSQSQLENYCFSSNLHSIQSFQNDSSEVERLKAENEKMKKSVKTLAHATETQKTVFQLQINDLIDQKKKMAVTIAEKETEIEQVMLELGRLNVELTRIQNRKTRDELFNKMYKFHSASTQTSGISEWSNTSLDAAVSSDQATEVRNNQVENHYGQESLNETASLTDIPHTAVDGNIYNNYKLLLLRIAHNLLKEDVLKLKQWVDNEFKIDVSGSVNALFLELDRKKIISITDLSRLKKFFEDNLRYDFVHLIDCYLLGEYSQLKIAKTSERLGSFNRGSNAQNGLTSQSFVHLLSAQRPSRSTTIGRSTRISRGPADEPLDNAHGYQRAFQGLSQVNSREIGGNIGGISGSTQRPTQRSVARNGPGSNTRRPHPVTSSSCGKETASNNSNTSQGVVVTDGGRREHGEVQASSPTVRDDQISTSRGSNGHKFSKSQPPDTDEDGQWLCSHYKRRCYVKFECCNKFWPCHRCHNSQSTCGKRKLKSRDTKQIKCFACGQEQPFAHHCSRCNAKFARYFCGQCKHLTGTDDNPYHCEKCGICRIHGDRSFHCDVCGVCLDVQLRGNHKCRAGSAHDECCICLEDAFTGCQILPCSHKVHKECATQMIRSGITRCPICRESFAHKLERRPHPSKKPPGKQ
ncbi:RING finger and CHY zinc finger domain-containing 1-like [Paramuricea clavata]|uniref:RING finger and CHY zinc finger domain-containing 1-like, partial n=1 Tax=Paramuricea clavata TaxID=317549 RepID=A0A6S7IEK7_PARCT|nr:RING finger and CHY zinc finger domain-containing 1-like [Paramuricea clavata]